MLVEMEAQLGLLRRRRPTVLKARVERACELCGADDPVAHLRMSRPAVYGAHGPIPLGMVHTPACLPGAGLTEQRDPSSFRDS